MDNWKFYPTRHGLRMAVKGNIIAHNDNRIEHFIRAEYELAVITWPDGVKEERQMIRERKELNKRITHEVWAKGDFQLSGWDTRFFIITVGFTAYLVIFDKSQYTWHQVYRDAITATGVNPDDVISVEDSDVSRIDREYHNQDFSAFPFLERCCPGFYRVVKHKEALTFDRSKLLESLESLISQLTALNSQYACRTYFDIYSESVESNLCFSRNR